jgi:hypothetical protein
MSTATVAAIEPAREDTSLSTAYRLLWLALASDLLAFGIGFDWDRRWHATLAFEDFFSPPHLFIYSTRARPSRSCTRRRGRVRSR